MNNLLLLEGKKKRNYILLLIITIFYSATYSASLWTKKFGQPLFGYIRYILLVFMLLVFNYYLLFFNKSKKRLLVILGLIFFVIYNSLFHYGAGVVPIVIFCAYATFLNQREVIYAYASGLLFSVLIVVLMSLVGILPIRTSDGFVTYGFGNPNSIGGFLACIFMSYLYLTWKKSKTWFLIMYVVITIINSVTFGDRSASVCMLIFLFAYLIRGYINKKCKLIGWMGIIMPIFLTIFSLILAYFYGRFNWIYSIDHILTKRIYTWNYYLNVDGLHLFPQSMNIVKANEYEIGFYGKNIDPLLRGFFDGGYMFMLIRMGIINAILMIGAIGNKFLELMKYHKTSLELLLLIFVFYTLPENEWIAPYAFYTSYLLVICFSQMTSNKY